MVQKVFNELGTVLVVSRAKLPAPARSSLGSSITCGLHEHSGDL
jgi:hypothetical protein